MLYQDVTHVSIDTFKKLSEDKQVILFYPWTNYRNLFLSYFLNNREGLLYYRISSGPSTLAEWLHAMSKEFQITRSGFGTNLNKVLPDGTPEELGVAFAKDLNKLCKKEECVLFVDELDRVPQNKRFRQFIRAFLDELNKNIKFAVNSRLLTYRPWAEMVADDEAIVLGTANRRTDLMFTVEDEPKPQLEVYAFGSGHVLVNGEPIETWDGALPRNLFFYFMDLPLVTRDQIFQTFWPKLDVKDATNVFHVTKRKITERISVNIDDGENYELTRYSAGFYLPSTKLVRHYDVDDFSAAMSQAMLTTDDVEQEKLYRQAIDIYKAPLLQTIEMDWVVERREELRELYAEALIGMGRVMQRQDHKEEAIGFYTRGLKENTTREDIYREVMNLYAQLGRHAEAIQLYEKLKKVLQQTVGISPSKDTEQVLQLIRSQN